ncbi:MAG: type IV pilin-like G/H family protein [Cyanobacteriota bacterium]
MSSILPNLCYVSSRFRVSGQFIAFGVLVGLLSTFSTPVSAKPAPTPSVAQAQNPPTANPVQTRLQGRWQVKDPRTGQTLTVIFTPDGKFFMLLPIDSGESMAVPFRYQINPTPQPMHLDVILPEEKQTVLTIFEFTDDNQLRLQLADTNPGQPRPSEFMNADLFQKVSEETTLPSDVVDLSDMGTQNERVTADFKRQANESREAEGRINIGAMNRAQQAYYLEYSKFATTIEDLGLGINPESENYRYQLLPQGNQRERVMITAQAKRPELKSYTGAVVAVKQNGEDLTVTGICETDEPSSTPPAMPTHRKGTGEFLCPAGSHLFKQ